MISTIKMRFTLALGAAALFAFATADMTTGGMSSSVVEYTKPRHD